MKAKTLTVAVLIILILSACVQDKLSPVATPIPSRIFVFPTITPDPACRPPCFYGIVPGKTTLTETLSLLHASKSQMDGSTLFWDAIGSSGYYNYVVFINRMAYAIRLEDKPWITFKDVVQQNGDPEIVVAGRPGGEAGWDNFILAYPSRGVAYNGGTVLGDLPTKRLIPTPETVVYEVIYFEPKAKDKFTAKDASFWLATSFPEILPWLGFGVSHVKIPE